MEPKLRSAFWSLTSNYTSGNKGQIKEGGDIKGVIKTKFARTVAPLLYLDWNANVAGPAALGTSK